MIITGTWKDLLLTTDLSSPTAYAVVAHRVANSPLHQRPQDILFLCPIHMICPLHYPAEVFGVFVSVHAASAWRSDHPTPYPFILSCCSLSNTNAPSYRDPGMYIYPAHMCATYLLPSRVLRFPRVVHAASTFVGSLRPHILLIIPWSLPTPMPISPQESGLIHDLLIYDS